MIKQLGSQKGQAIVEFAFMLPLIAIILIGIIDFSILFYNKAVVTNASREGARRGSVANYTTTGTYSPFGVSAVSSAVTDYLSGRAVSFGSTTPSTTVCWSTSPTGPWTSCTTPPSSQPSPPTSNYIYVRVTYGYTFLAFSRLAGWGNTFNVVAETIMRME